MDVYVDGNKVSTYKVPCKLGADIKGATAYDERQSYVDFSKAEFAYENGPYVCQCNNLLNDLRTRCIMFELRERNIQFRQYGKNGTIELL